MKRFHRLNSLYINKATIVDNHVQLPKHSLTHMLTSKVEAQVNTEMNRNKMYLLKYLLLPKIQFDNIHQIPATHARPTFLEVKC
jgi:hypothetical protein